MCLWLVVMAAGGGGDGLCLWLAWFTLPSSLLLSLCECVCECMHVCVHACVCVHASYIHAVVCACMHVCVLINR